MRVTVVKGEVDVQRARGCAVAAFASRRLRRTHPPLFAVCCLDIFPAANVALYKYFYTQTAHSKPTTVDLFHLVWV